MNSLEHTVSKYRVSLRNWKLKKGNYIGKTKDGTKRLTCWLSKTSPLSENSNREGMQ